MNFGRAIRTISAARGLSQQQLAARVGMDTAFLSRIGKAAGPSTQTLSRIAKALETPLYLLVLLASDVDDLGDGAADVTALGPHLLAALIGRSST